MAAVGLAVAVEAAVFRAGAAGLADLFLEGFAGTVYAHGGVLRGDVGLASEIV